MVKEIVAAPMPVVVYVSANGARAASAGLFVTQAADVAAMAPQTNIGSATPVRDKTTAGRSAARSMPRVRTALASLRPARKRASSAARSLLARVAQSAFSPQTPVISQ
jgi:membrane-bound serine protease (ClpP class)